MVLKRVPQRNHTGSTVYGKKPTVMVLLLVVVVVEPPVLAEVLARRLW